MPHQAAKVFRRLTRKYEAGQTTKSQLAHDAEYAAQGHDTEPWRPHIGNSAADTGRAGTCMRHRCRIAAMVGGIRLVVSRAAGEYTRV
jgi:hypothetical protein